MNCTAIPPSAPKSACRVSPFLASTTRVNEPARTRWPGLSATPCWPSLLASQATPKAGWPSTPAASPVSSISEFLYMMPPTQRRSTSIGPTGRPLAENESEFDFDARLAEVGVLDLGAVADHLVVEDVAVVRLVDHRGAL